MGSKLFQWVKNFENKRRQDWIEYRAGERSEPILARVARMGGISHGEQDVAYGLRKKNESDVGGFRAESRAKIMRTPTISKERGGRKKNYWEY